ncbi:MAG: hypothetical protein K9M98_15330 [Cephaloticoccus sp.]|nr:hypothetical protein [Cephaloticoccus sp.]MCF7761872.1 hypothetical protein [Cephaloticoccus sp.]
MNPKHQPFPDEEAINRLLSRRYRDTSPEFEQRWIDLKRELRQHSPGGSTWFPSRQWAGWLGMLGAIAAIAFVVHTSRTPVPTTAADMDLSPQLTELLAMDQLLSQATPLLDAENRAALLNLPANR